jgi:hypothetical protein
MQPQETTVTIKEALHRLVDELPDEELPEAERMLQALTIADPVERSLALAPIDDEVETEEELEGVREARAQAARGELIPDDQLEL